MVWWGNCECGNCHRHRRDRCRCRQTGVLHRMRVRLEGKSVPRWKCLQALRHRPRPPSRACARSLAVAEGKRGERPDRDAGLGSGIEGGGVLSAGFRILIDRGGIRGAGGRVLSESSGTGAGGIGGLVENGGVGFGGAGGFTDGGGCRGSSADSGGGGQKGEGGTARMCFWGWQQR